MKMNEEHTFTEYNCRWVFDEEDGQLRRRSCWENVRQIVKMCTQRVRDEKSRGPMSGTATGRLDLAIQPNIRNGTRANKFVQ